MFFWNTSKKIFTWHSMENITFSPACEKDSPRIHYLECSIPTPFHFLRYNSLYIEDGSSHCMFNFDLGFYRWPSSLLDWFILSWIKNPGCRLPTSRGWIFWNCHLWISRKSSWSCNEVFQHPYGIYQLRCSFDRLDWTWKLDFWNLTLPKW